MSLWYIRTAARAYFAYAVVYWIGGMYLVWHGVGIPGPITPAKRAGHLAFWGLIALLPTFVIPYLLRRPRAWFERSVQSGGWPAFGFIVSEIELRRLRQP